MSQTTKHQEQSTKNKAQGDSRDNEVLVRVEGVSKIFCRDLKKSLLYGLKDSAKDLVSWGNKEPKTKNHRQRLRPSEFLAVNDVSFELKRGECLGLIGHNGAGKTTLLKMLNGLIKPDAGRIEMRGRVGALIALGAGFNPILSGRENIYVNGSILGLSKKEIDTKIDEIIDFAGLSDYINMPVQNYSSGMQVRLGFAVATSLIPDVLILDEILAVGDEHFQLKCFTKIADLISKGVTVILVTHQLQNIARICNRAILLEKGAISADSRDIKKIITNYQLLPGRGHVFDESPKIFYNQQCDIKLQKIDTYSPGVVRLSVKNISNELFDFKVSYSLYSSGMELCRGFDKEHSFRIEGLGDCNFEILCTISEFDIRDLKLNISLWQEGIPKPILWVKDIEVVPATEGERKSLIKIQ